MAQSSRTTEIQYIVRINRVIDFIQDHLDHEFTLDELAPIANFSKYHFHRVFYSLVGETLFNFIQRLRVEKAAILIKNNPLTPLTDIALSVGFSSSALFSRRFKAHFGLSPSAYKKNPNNPGLSMGGNLGEIKNSVLTFAVSQQNNTQIWTPVSHPTEDDESTIQAKKVRVVDFPTLHLAYYRYTGPYKGDAQLFKQLWTKLMQWAFPRELVIEGKTEFLAIYHDDLSITDESKLRTSVCLSIHEGTETDGEIGSMSLKGGRYAMARFVLGPSDYAAAWEWVFSQWLPQSGYQADDLPSFEYFPSQTEEVKSKGKQVVDICIPVKPFTY